MSFKFFFLSYPWSDDNILRGQTKCRFSVFISTTTGFDTEFSIFEESGLPNAFYKESRSKQHGVDTLKWCNLLLEYGFYKVEE